MDDEDNNMYSWSYWVLLSIITNNLYHGIIMQAWIFETEKNEIEGVWSRLIEMPGNTRIVSRWVWVKKAMTDEKWDSCGIRGSVSDKIHMGDLLCPWMIDNANKRKCVTTNRDIIIILAWNSHFHHRLSWLLSWTGFRILLAQQDWFYAAKKQVNL